jgi:hypothetical protein
MILFSILTKINYSECHFTLSMRQSKHFCDINVIRPRNYWNFYFNPNNSENLFTVSELARYSVSLFEDLHLFVLLDANIQVSFEDRQSFPWH